MCSSGFCRHRCTKALQRIFRFFYGLFFSVYATALGSCLTQYKVFISLVYLIVNRVGMVLKPYKFQNGDSAIHFDSTTTMHNLCFCVFTWLSNLQELFCWLVAPTQLKLTLVWVRSIASIHYINSLFLF